MAEKVGTPGSVGSGEKELSASARWWGGRNFELQVRGHRLTIDSSGKDGPAAMEGLLGSLAACLGSMVADILEVMREPFEILEVSARGIEGSESPRVFHTIHVEVCLSGVTREKAERAVHLAETKYCPVTAMVRRAGTDLQVKTVLVEEPHAAEAPRTSGAP